jgi:hypothetical protein
MPTIDFESGRTIPLQIPEPVGREWKINGVDADHLAELQAEYSAATGYEFDWGQIIEEVFHGTPTAGSDKLEDPPHVACGRRPTVRTENGQQPFCRSVLAVQLLPCIAATSRR